MMELYANELHFLGNDEESQREDLCIHEGVFFKVNDTVISDLKKDGSWCVSASALRFLRSLFKSVFFGAEEHMIPCCGHFMIASEDKKRVTIIGCNNGIDFDVIHENNGVIICLEDGMEQRITYSEYREAVLAFAGQIKDFFDKSPARIFTDDFERDGFEAFQTEFSELLNRTIIDPEHIVNGEIRFDDYHTFSNSAIQGIADSGISLYECDFINFRECAYNFKRLNGGNGNCIGERDIGGSYPSITFYTAPLTTKIVFLNETAPQKTHNKIELSFISIQNKLSEFGYTLCDIDSIDKVAR